MPPNCLCRVDIGAGNAIHDCVGPPVSFSSAARPGQHAPTQIQMEVWLQYQIPFQRRHFEPTDCCKSTIKREPSTELDILISSRSAFSFAFEPPLLGHNLSLEAERESLSASKESLLRKRRSEGVVWAVDLASAAPVIRLGNTHTHTRLKR